MGLLHSVLIDTIFFGEENIAETGRMIPLAIFRLRICRPLISLVSRFLAEED